MQQALDELALKWLCAWRVLTCGANTCACLAQASAPLPVAHVCWQQWCWCWRVAGYGRCSRTSPSQMVLRTRNIGGVA